MKARSRRWLIILLCVLLGLGLLFLPGLPWSARARHTLHRALIKAEIVLARWRGHEPRLVSLSGKIDVPGAQVEALDSRSGWATLADKDGRFTLPDEMWYPRASYDLVISSDHEHGEIIKVTAPEKLPDSGVIDLGQLHVDPSHALNLDALPGITSVTFANYDEANRPFYQELFDKLTANQASDTDKLNAIQNYMRTKRNFEETQREVDSPRQVLERGSQYCGLLSTAMATLLATGHYQVHTIDLRDNQAAPLTHVIVEVYYDNAWHLYDPTYGVTFLNKAGNVESYRDVRLEPSIITPELLAGFPSQRRPNILALLSGVYNSGYHHYYYFKD